MNTNIIITGTISQYGGVSYHLKSLPSYPFGQEGKPTIRSPRTSSSCQFRNRAADDNESICSPSFGCFRQMVK